MIRSPQIRTDAKSAVARCAGILLLNFFTIGSAACLAADLPRAEISNGQITLRMHLPDARNGYYRSTRFDWSGAVYRLQYKGHESKDERQGPDAPGSRSVNLSVLSIRQPPGRSTGDVCHVVAGATFTVCFHWSCCSIDEPSWYFLASFAGASPRISILVRSDSPALAAAR